MRKNWKDFYLFHYVLCLLQFFCFKFKDEMLICASLLQTSVCLFAFYCVHKNKKMNAEKKIIYILYKDRHAAEKSVNRNKYPKNWWYRIPLSHGKIFERDKIMIQFFSFQFRFDVFHLFRAIDDYICFNSG